MEARILNALAPIRVCDLGGWTDTWFADTGVVLNIAVSPYAEAQMTVRETAPGEERHIIINAENFGDSYEIDPDEAGYSRHPLLEAAIDIMEIPDNISFEVNLYSAAPAGCSTGTSAAIAVALVGALDMLTPGQCSPHEVAALAQRVETEKLGLQCGIQDQLASAYGGISFIEMFKYPHATVSQIALPERTWWELERRLVLVFLGDTHSSSDVHKQVIEGLERDKAKRTVLEPLRQAARAGKNALYKANFEAFGQSMTANTEAQEALHPALLSEDAKAIIELAKQHRAIGWKLNGAGGDGGSLTILCGPESRHKRAFVEALPELNPKFRAIPIRLGRHGLRRWEACS